MTKYSDLIKATIIADSITNINNTDARMTTFEIEYPRFILAELNTHRMLSKNSASSRAIPSEAMRKFIDDSPAGPVWWGKNQSGMQAKEPLNADDAELADHIWNLAKHDALHWSEKMAQVGTHKQITNRITEPWMTMKTVISGTEWANFFHLRDHPDAQPEFAELAFKMREAYCHSVPDTLQVGEWHLPYISVYPTARSIRYFAGADELPDLEAAKIVSASCCAQVSYRKNDDSYEKAIKIYKQLIESTPAHASPVEHQATPMPAKFHELKFESMEALAKEGVSHMDTNYQLWSGNLRGWIQFRKTIPNEAVW